MDSKDLEKELWDKMDAVLNEPMEVDLFDILNKVDYDGFIEQIEQEDYILALAGMDDQALDRIEVRRENLRKVKEQNEIIKQKREEALKRVIAKREKAAER